MAGDEILRSLITTLELKAQSWNNDIKAAQREAKAFSNEWKASLGVMKEVGTALSAAGAAITGSMLLATKMAVDFGDELNDLRQKTGASVENLSRLTFAAEQSGSSLDGISTGLKFLSKNMELAIGGSKQQQQAFGALGISSRDLAEAHGDVNKVFLTLADRFKELPDGASKSALAMQIFGKSGTDLIPTLNEGSAGIQKLGDNAAAAGHVITQDFASASDKLNDTIHEAETAVGGLSISVASALLPSLQSAAETARDTISAFADFAKQHEDLTKLVFGLGVALTGAGGLLLGITAVGAVIGPLTVGIAALGGAMAVLSGVAIIGLVVAVGSLVKGMYDAEVAIEGARKATEEQSKSADKAVESLRAHGIAIDTTGMSADQATQAIAKAGQQLVVHKQVTDEAAATAKWFAEKTAEVAQAHKDAEAANKAADEQFKEWGKTLATIPIGRFTDDFDRLSAVIHDFQEGTDRAHDKWKDFRELLGLPIPDVNLDSIFSGIDFGAATANTNISALKINVDQLKTTVDGYGPTTKEVLAQSAADWKAYNDAVAADQKRMDDAIRDVKESAGHIFDDMFIRGEGVFESLGNALKGGALSLGRSIFEDVTGALLGPIKKAFDDFFTGLLEGSGIKSFLSGLGDKLGGLLGGVFGGGSDVVSSVAGGASSAAGGASSAVGSVSSGVTGLVSAVSGVVGAISGIIGNFQTARLEGTMNAVEANTRATYIDLEIIANQHLSQMIYTLGVMNQSLTWINMAIDQSNAELVQIKGAIGGSYVPVSAPATTPSYATPTIGQLASTTSTATGGDPDAPVRDAVGQWLYHNFTIDPGAAYGSPYHLHVTDPISIFQASQEGTVLDAYRRGTDYVPRTGIYQLHQGEAVIPAEQNYGSGSDRSIVVVIEVDGREIARAAAPHLYDLTRNEGWRLTASR